MDTALNILAIVLFINCLALIGLVLMQNKKGDALTGGMMGGSSSTIFGSEGSGNVLEKITKWLAFFFMTLCIAIAALQSRKLHSSVTEGISMPAAPVTAPVAPEAPAQPNTGSAPAP